MPDECDSLALADDKVDRVKEELLTKVYRKVLNGYHQRVWIVWMRE